LLSAAVAVIALQPPPLLRVALLVFFAYAFLTTGSFGIAVAAGAAIFVRVVQRTGSVDPRVRFVTRIGLGLLVVTFAVYVMRSVSVSDLDIGRGFSGERFERSGDSRSELWLRAVTAWSDYPTGVGFSDNPGGTPLFSTSGAREPHSDVLSALLNGGPLAVIGMFVSLLGFYRLLSPGGLGRVLLATMVVGGVFRQTWNFRHLWLLLGVLAASELLARLRRTSSEAHDNAPPSGSRD
jgi:4-amino-4-deoxy-L-arabinose transferase-like glycosyltransferase